MSDEDSDVRQYLGRDDEALREHLVRSSAEAEQIRERLEKSGGLVWFEVLDFVQMVSEGRLGELDGKCSVGLFLNLRVSAKIKESLPGVLDSLIDRLWLEGNFLHLILLGEKYFFDED